MRLLLDTHAFLFAISAPDRLGPQIRGLLQQLEIERWVSAITLNEIAIKVSLGKLSFPADRAFYLRHMEQLGARVLPFEMNHAFAVFDLPLHHRDPFDRMLIAQAREEGLVLATRDAAFAPYPVQSIW